ncbi:TonB-dependent receptor [Pedobacter nyackensis]|uniref:SusC/RagA family TonB-linked outer membrane protein n=1 Tax=Pedobacter nyackensis TaxID=475255 RepID=UPI002930F767|nr:TonB-dependent receptor [Pedobacter nyackensis]
MKIAFFIVLITCLNVSAKVFSQQKLSLDVQNIKLQKALQIIEKRSSYRFVYSPTEGPFNKTVSIKTFEASLEDVMRELLEGTALSFYVQENNLVTILPRNNTIQDVSIRGAVKDTEGVPLPGVTVSVKGVKGMGTSTDNQGRFSLKVPDNATIVFSTIGFETLEIPASATMMNVVLKASNNSLDEVVVQAYGKTTRRATTSAISTLDMKNVAQIPVASINDAVAGRLPGVIVTANNGAPGSKSTISIRGGGTPLFVIDNVIRSSNDFANLNPNDIEEYSILKDAAATALYGVSAANGVVIVTTKRGKEGQASINYAYNQIFSQPTLFPEKLSAYEQAVALNDLAAFEGRSPFRTPEDLEKVRTGSDPLIFPNTDWQALTMKDFAPEMRHDLSLTSGTKALTYYASLSHYDQGTILRTEKNFNKRTTYRLNTTSDIEKINLRITAGIDGFIEANSQPYAGYGGVYSHIQNRQPSQLAVNEFGLPTSQPDNPVRELDPLSGYNKITAKIFNSNLGLEYSAPFLDGLKLKVNGAYTTYNNFRKIWSYLAPAYNIGSKTPINAGPPSLTNEQGQGATLTLQGYLTYNKTFGDHAFDFTSVFERQTDDFSFVNGMRQNYQIIFDQIIAGPTLNATTNGSEGEKRRAAILARLKYTYQSKYTVEGSIRRDGDFIFPPGSQWGTFYAASANYVISEENFMKSLKEKHILDFLKLRGSYGELGDKKDLISGEEILPFQYVPAYGLNANAWVINGNLVQGSSEPGALPRSQYSWQTIASRNLGLEFGTLNNRLTGGFDYFYTRRKGFVASDPRFASTLGVGLPLVNVPGAAFRTEGFEFNVNYASNIKDFSYKVGVNFTRSNTLWERFPTESEGAIKNPYNRRSNTAGNFFGNGLHSLGFYTDNSQLLTGARFDNANIIAGDLRYFDANGDGRITDDDQRRIGSSAFPRTNYGITLDLGYKGFSFNAVVQGAGNRDRYIGDVLQGSSNQNQLVYGYQLDYWRPDNTDARFPRAVSTPGINGGNNFRPSDAWLIQSKYVRLKYVQLGYDFKEGVLKKIPFQQLRLFVSGTNLLTSAKSQDYFLDPESGTNNLNNYEYPIQRTFAIGLAAGF